MIKISAWLTLAGSALMAILIVVSVVIVMNTIRTAVYHRRQEIEVMKLVGATEWFVRGPFVIEGVMTGVLAASLALGLLVGVYRPFVERFRADERSPSRRGAPRVQRQRCDHRAARHRRRPRAPISARPTRPRHRHPRPDA